MKNLWFYNKTINFLRAKTILINVKNDVTNIALKHRVEEVLNLEVLKCSITADAQKRFHRESADHFP